MNALRRLPLVQLLIAGLSVFVVLVGFTTLALRGSGGKTAAASHTPAPPGASSAPSTGPAAPTTTAPPAPLAVAAVPKLLHGLKADAASPPQVGATIQALLGASALGTGVTAAVVDARTGQPLAQIGATTQAPPASTAKLATAAAALRVLGPSYTMSTTVVAGTTPNQVVLVGGGDPTLAGSAPDAPGTYPVPATLASLATSAAKSLKGKTVTVAYDNTLYSGSASAEGWKPSYFSAGNVAPVSSLEVDEGRKPGKGFVGRADDPGLLAAQEFATLLSHDGVKVTGTPGPGVVAAGSKPIAKVVSPPVSALVERMLRISDNDLAESLARQVALKLKLPGTFAGAAQGVAQALAPLGVDATALHMVDGSGLSTSDTLQAAALTKILSAATSNAHPELRYLLSGLPVAGFLGTLSTRYLSTSTAAGVGAVRAKTGTLTGVSSLAGVVVDADGRQLAFAVIAGHVSPTGTVSAEAALDRVATALAGCGCR